MTSPTSKSGDFLLHESSEFDSIAVQEAQQLPRSCRLISSATRIMAIQRNIEVSVSSISKRKADRPKPEIIDGLGGWRISHVTIGYLTAEAQVGKTLTVALGFTNLTDADVTLRFPSNRRIVISILNASNEAVYASAAGTGPAGTQTIKATKGIYWTEKIVLAAEKFQPGSYVLAGQTDSDLKCGASVMLVVAA